MEKPLHQFEYRIFTRRLRKARLEAGLSQNAVARELKKPQSYVSKAENGERRLDVIELRELSKLYKKPIEFFL